MKFVAAAGLLVLSLSSAFAEDSVECNNRQVVNYEVSTNLIESNDKSRMLYLNAGSSRKLYLKLNVKAVDSRDLGTIEQDVTGHYTKKTKDIVCFKQEVEAQNCATYSCNILLKK